MRKREREMDVEREKESFIRLYVYEPNFEMWINC